MLLRILKDSTFQIKLRKDFFQIWFDLYSFNDIMFWNLIFLPLAEIIFQLVEFLLILDFGPVTFFFRKSRINYTNTLEYVKD